SFVQSANDMRRARDLTAAAGAADVPLVAKLERPQALDDLAGILAASDAVMVARGDLGLEMPLASVPRAQKEITRRARAQGVPVIVATQVLESMMHEARPTRAEVNDAAGANIGRELVARGWIRSGSTVVLISISPDLSRADANYLKMQRL